MLSTTTKLFPRILFKPKNKIYVNERYDFRLQKKSQKITLLPKESKVIRSLGGLQYEKKDLDPADKLKEEEERFENTSARVPRIEKSSFGEYSDLVPNSTAPELKTIIKNKVKLKKIPLDNDFFNTLLKKLALRSNKKYAKTVIDKIQLKPNLVTYGDVSVLACNEARDQSKDILKTTKTTLLFAAFVIRDFGFILVGLMKRALHQPLVRLEVHTLKKLSELNKLQKSITRFVKRKVQTILNKISKKKDEVERLHKKVGIIGVPFEKGQKKGGVALAPDTLRAAGLISELQMLGLEVHDYGDIEYEILDITVDNMSKMGHIAGCTQRLSEKVQQALNEGKKVLTIGGDHSIGIGSIDGHVKFSKNVALVWIDAHADLNTNKTSESGNVHGMSVALLTAELSDYWPYLPGMDWQQPLLSINDVAYIGLRSVDSYERLVIEKFGITAFGMKDIEKYGIDDVIKMALKKIDPDKNKSLHVSFDIDSLDPLEAPSTGTPVRGGLSLREGIHVMEELYRTHRLNALDLVEVNPKIGDKESVDKTVSAAIHIIQAGFGYSRRGFKVPEGVTDMPLQTFKNK